MVGESRLIAIHNQLEGSLSQARALDGAGTASQNDIAGLRSLAKLLNTSPTGQIVDAARHRIAALAAHVNFLGLADSFVPVHRRQFVLKLTLSSSRTKARPTASTRARTN
jgi:hypothetical protein